MVLTGGKDEKVLRMTKNISKVATMRAEDVNVMGLLNKEAVVVGKEALKQLESQLEKD